MAALVQTFPQQTGTVAMLQARPSSNSGIMPANQSHANHQYMAAPSQAPRSAYPAVGSSGYRGSAAPVQPYAFTSTPNLNQNASWQQQHSAYRTRSSPAVPGAPTYDANPTYRPVFLGGPSSCSTGSQPQAVGGVGHGGSRDDSVLRNTATPSRSQPFLSVNAQPPFGSGTTGRTAPDRYRRPSGGAVHHARSQSSTLPSGITVINSTTQLHGAAHRGHGHSVSAGAGGKGLVSVSSMDDMHLHHRQAHEGAKRARRPSMHVEAPELQRLASPPGDGARAGATSPARYADGSSRSQRPASSAAHSRNGSADSMSSTLSSHSRPSSVSGGAHALRIGPPNQTPAMAAASLTRIGLQATNLNAPPPPPTGNPSLLASDEAPAKADQPKVAVPSRGSSADVAKRTNNPSPLSKPATMAGESAEDPSPPGPASTAPVGATMDSPAAKQLAALTQKGAKGKSKTSRLRRAFSFGSAADFRKAAAGADTDGADKMDASRLQREPTADEAYDAEQARIAEAQEAAGIGNNIYGGRFFGSTDNLSISSTASSASIMIRKMGRGMKKSTRSLVGLFRPKSVIGVPAADTVAPEASQAAVSMITVEAETQRVNVTADPAAGNGGTGFPRLERNSLDASQVPEMSDRAGSLGTDNDWSGPRKSIVGGDKERADVLAAVRKGILKRESMTPRRWRDFVATDLDTGSSSPSVRQPGASPDLVLPSIPAVADSPMSSAPSTPNDESQGHRRTGSIAIGNEDYFMSALRLRRDARSPPGTPQAGAKRSATFSPRIVFYDTWPSQEYDRRGEVATCNRLTPMLAQQIKEELNTFKMVSVA